MNRLEVRQLVVVGVDAHAEEQARVPPVHDLVVAELGEVGLVFLVAGCDEAVDLCGNGISEMGGEEGGGRGGRGEGGRRTREGRTDFAFQFDFLFVLEGGCC